MAINIKQNTFNYIGNLAFYDGWKPNYIYFRTLRAAGEQYSDNANNRWRTDLAWPIAERAIADINTHDHLPEKSQEESNQHFLEQFNKIVLFLQNAIKYERANERAYFSQLLDQLKGTWDAQTINAVKPLTQLKTMLENGSQGFNYTNFITLINILQQGLDNTKTLAAYEQDRIVQINKTLERIEQSRFNQAAGLKKSKQASLEDQVKSGEKAQKKLSKKIEAEYLKTGGLARKKDNGKYILYGGGLFEKYVNPTMDRVVSKWAEDTLNTLLENGNFIEQIVTKLKINYPVDGNFKRLKADIQEAIILNVITYGMNNLQSILKKELSTEIIKDVEQSVLNSNDFFDGESSFKIHGLDSTFGRKIDTPSLFFDAETISKLVTNHALELFRIIADANKKIEASEQGKESYPLLIEALKGHTTARGNTSLKELSDIIDLIDKIDKLYTEVKTLQDKWEKKKKKNQKKMTITSESIPTITIIIDGDNVQIDMKELMMLIKSQPGYEYLDFKEFNYQSLRYTLIGLKRKASLELKDALISGITEMVNNSVNGLTEKELIQNLGSELTNIKIDIDGPTLLELIHGLQVRQNAHGTYIEWPRKGIKNDMVTIQINYRSIIKQIQTGLKDLPMLEKIFTQQTKVFNKIFEKEQLKLIAMYQEEIHKRALEVNDPHTYEPEKYSKMSEKIIVDDNQIQKNSEEMAQAIEKFNRRVNNLFNMYKFNKSQDGIKALEITQQAYLNTLYDAFYISTTVKSRNTYVNKFGFTGGSLGGTLSQQLARVADIFNNAGMKIEDSEQEWLYSAILNCFPGSVTGEKNKPLIENYLGSLIAFALFDEGGSEEAIISDYYKTVFSAIRDNHTGKNIMHLYYLNGLYYPGSFILERVLQSLQTEVIPNIKQIPNTMKRGAGITIINNIDQSTIPNRPIFNRLSWDENAWSTAGQNADKQVTLKILFLAGLLDIINSINTAINNTELPA